MPGGVPDLQRVQRNAQAVMGAAGETALLLTYVGTAGGAARYGVTERPNYTSALITGLFTNRQPGLAAPTETQLPGGTVEQALLRVTTDRPVGARDQVVWRGSAYRAAGTPMPESVGGRALWQTPLALAMPTG